MNNLLYLCRITNNLKVMEKVQSLREAYSGGVVSKLMIKKLGSSLVDEMLCLEKPIALSLDNVYYDCEKEVMIIASDDNPVEVSEQEMVRQYGELVMQFFDKIVGDNTIAELEPLRFIAERCLSGDVVSLKELYKLSEHRINRKLYPMLIVFVVLLIALLAFLDHYFKSL